jgi:MATE family multidrug resistance protein
VKAAHGYWKEGKTVFSLALPMILGLLAQQALAIADTAMIGRVGVIELAACAFANTIFYIFLLVGYGFGLAVTILTARAVGSGVRAAARRVLAAGLVLNGLLATVFIALMHAGVPLLDFLGQDPLVVETALPYFLLLSWTTLPILIFNVFKCYGEANNRVWFPLFYIGGSVVLNIFLNWVFIFGNLGSPELGLWGAGLATLIARTACLVAIIFHFRISRFFRLRWRGFPWGSVKLSEYGAMVRLGFFTAMQLLFEAGAFSVAALLMGMIGAVQLAAHQIALTVAATTFMIPLGLSFAVGIRVGQAVGRNDLTGVRRSGYVTLLLSLGAMTVCMGIILLLREPLATLFVGSAYSSSDDAAMVAEVIRLAAGYLLIAGLFQVFDGAQVVLVGALRGLQDVKLPTAMVFFAYYVVCIPLGATLAFKFAWEGEGIWTGLLVGLVGSTFLLLWRFHRSSRRPQIIKLPIESCPDATKP